MAEPGWAALAELAASSLRQWSLALRLSGTWVRVVRAAPIVPASRADAAGQLIGELPGIAGQWPLFAVTGW